MKYAGTSWEITYKNAYRLFTAARSFDDITAKGRTLKQALNATILLPEDYEGKYELAEEIENYARHCGIDLDKISGY